MAPFFFGLDLGVPTGIIPAQAHRHQFSIVPTHRRHSREGGNLVGCLGAGGGREIALGPRLRGMTPVVWPAKGRVLQAVELSRPSWDSAMATTTSVAAETPCFAVGDGEML